MVAEVATSLRLSASTSSEEVEVGIRLSTYAIQTFTEIFFKNNIDISLINTYNTIIVSDVTEQQETGFIIDTKW